MPNDANSEFVAQPHLTAVAETYRNPDVALIADEVLPRVPVGSMQFTYQKATDPLEALRLPETNVGPRGRTPSLELGMTEVPDICEDNGIEIPLSKEDLKRGKTKEGATTVGTSIIKLRHEVRVAAVATATASYDADLIEVVSGTDQFDNAGYDGDALVLVQDGLDKMFLPATVLGFSLLVWSKFRRLPEVVSAVLGNSGEKGLVKPEQVANLFGVQQVVIGAPRIVTSKPGEATVVSNAWGKNMFAIHRNRAASTEGGVTFGFTAEYEKIQSGELPSADISVRGGVRVRTYESNKPVSVAPMAGHLWTNCIS